MSDETIVKQADLTITAFRDHAWDYFALHADQRLKTFHFYILLETGLVAAMLVAARAGTSNAWIYGVIGIFMVLLSFVFWKLDQRTKGMIKVAEEALKEFEAQLIQALDNEWIRKYAPFSNDAQAIGLVSKSPLAVLSYSKCFGTVFIAFAVLGVGIALAFLSGRASP
jgi:hypothetical protein